MIEKIVLTDPMGNPNEYEVICHFKSISDNRPNIKNVQILIVDTKKENNGNKVLGFFWEKDGMYQAINDDAAWTETKSVVVDVIKNTMKAEEISKLSATTGTKSIGEPRELGVSAIQFDSLKNNFVALVGTAAVTTENTITETPVAPQNVAPEVDVPAQTEAVVNLETQSVAVPPTEPVDMEPQAPVEPQPSPVVWESVQPDNVMNNIAPEFATPVAPAIESPVIEPVVTEPVATPSVEQPAVVIPDPVVVPTEPVINMEAPVSPVETVQPEPISSPVVSPEPVVQQEPITPEPTPVESPVIIPTAIEESETKNMVDSFNKYIEKKKALTEKYQQECEQLDKEFQIELENLFASENENIKAMQKQAEQNLKQATDHLKNAQTAEGIAMVAQANAQKLQESQNQAGTILA